MNSLGWIIWQPGEYIPLARQRLLDARRHLERALEYAKDKRFDLCEDRLRKARNAYRDAQEFPHTVFGMMGL